MPQVRIPSASRAPLRSLALLDEASFDRLADAIGQGQPAGIDEFVQRLQGTGIDLPADSARPLLDSLIGAKIFSDWSDWSSVDAAEAFANSEDLDVAFADRAVLKTRLETLFNSADLSTLARAIDIAAEHERLFHHSRVLSDVRPIFPTAIPGRPAAAVLVHQLEIEYHDANGLRSWYVSMSDRDLDQLGSAVDRAKAKSASLRDFLANGNLPLLDVEED